MISHAAFGVLRLAHFVAAEEITALENWEFLDRLWLGEAVQFSEWLRDYRTPDRLGSMALDESLSPKTWNSVLNALGLPLRKGMTVPEIEAVLGPVEKTSTFTNDRTTHEFRTPQPEEYWISCATLNNGGLTYLVVTVPEPPTDA